MLACLWIVQTVFLEDIYTNIKLNQTEHCANLIASSVKTGKNTVDAVDYISQNNEISVDIFDSSGNIIIKRYTSEYINPVGKIDLTMSQVYEYYNLAYENMGKYQTVHKIERSSDIFDNPFIKDSTFKRSAQIMVFAEIIPIEENVECFIIVTSMITPVHSVIKTLRAQLIAITIIFFIIAAILAFFVSRRISKPLITINNQVKEIAKQNYNVEFNGKGYKEVQELSNTLNFTKDELKKVEALRQELIANVSHDLRTPLTMITGYAEVMRDLPNENTPENLQVIIDEANRLSNLVTDVLDLSKIQSGATELQLETYNLTQSIRDIFNRYTKLVQQEGYIIELYADKDVYVTADQIKMGQVIYNFINNAINHCGEKKTVIVNQKVYYGRVKIEVIDYGEGIEPEKLSQIWDRYYKVDKNHKRGVIGTGLGLSIVKRILEMHQARYGVKSKLGHGSVFWFDLPVAKGKK